MAIGENIKLGFAAGKDARQLAMQHKKTWLAPTMLLLFGLSLMVIFTIVGVIVKKILPIGQIAESIFAHPILKAIGISFLTLSLIFYFAVLSTSELYLLHYTKSRIEADKASGFFRSLLFAIGRLKKPFTWLYILLSFLGSLLSFILVPALAIPIVCTNKNFKTSLEASWFLFKTFFWKAFGFLLYIIVMAFVFILIVSPIIVLLQMQQSQQPSTINALLTILGVIFFIAGTGFLVSTANCFYLRLYKEASKLRPDLFE